MVKYLGLDQVMKHLIQPSLFVFVAWYKYLSHIRHGSRSYKTHTGVVRMTIHAVRLDQLRSDQSRFSVIVYQPGFLIHTNIVLSPVNHSVVSRNHLFQETLDCGTANLSQKCDLAIMDTRVQIINLLQWIH